ncbi:type II toxin-antitoxin system RelE/ParE family toxin [Candidatus Saccharibacteria bacterium]|nr:type II toxin-antitoxin system RelE/ParE family toxin [Candidatus Saccharibacteria bacterium]
MAFQYSFSDQALSSYRECLNYLTYLVGGTGNPQAAKNFVHELDVLLKVISESASSFTLVDNEELRLQGYYKLHFKKMKYKIIYHIENRNQVIIDLIIHDSRDYENLL